MCRLKVHEFDEAELMRKLILTESEIADIISFASWHEVEPKFAGEA